jgi:hypothetical protein
VVVGGVGRAAGAAEESCAKSESESEMGKRGKEGVRGKEKGERGAREGGEVTLTDMLKELDLADKYVHALESEEIDLEILCDTLKVGGRAALVQLLQDAGVDKLGPRGKIANFVQKITCCA